MTISDKISLIKMDGSSPLISDSNDDCDNSITSMLSEETPINKAEIKDNIGNKDVNTDAVNSTLAEICAKVRLV